jgi:hypothetical protein
MGHELPRRNQFVMSAFTPKADKAAEVTLSTKLSKIDQSFIGGGGGSLTGGAGAVGPGLR